MDGGDDARVGAATADVAVHTGCDLGGSWLGSIGQQRSGADDHARGAVPALEGVFVQKGLLYGAEVAVVFKTFDGSDPCASSFAGSGLARAGGLAIEQHGTGSALAFAAAIFRSGQIESVAKDGQKCLVGGYCDRHLGAIYV